ncbi:MAG: GrpB family protein [Myxococcales bacterium]|nr:GrpB family protein [Myxococcales bacterium]USN51051.1 MAG: GrpB family protein [Myxococcales bacterium]
MSKTKLINLLISYELGLKRGTILLKPHTPKWIKAFKHISLHLHNHITNIECHHIGSTCFKHGFAKPIVDVLIIFHPCTDFLQESKKIESLGFTYKGDYGIAKRHFFALYNDTLTIDYVHLHAFPRGNENIQKLLCFKEKLQFSFDLVNSYNQLKQSLVAQGVSRKEYPHAKGDWITKVISTY